METLESLKQEILKAEKILAESKDNYENNPDSYSAKLLLISTENYLGDLYQKLDKEIKRNKSE